MSATDADIPLGCDASETTLERPALAQDGIINFATHGRFAATSKDSVSPRLHSRSGSASELDDGLLTASEVTQLKLNADRIVLSTCNTSGDKPGRGPVGIGALVLLFRCLRASCVALSGGFGSCHAFDHVDVRVAQDEPKIGRGKALRVRC